MEAPKQHFFSIETCPEGFRIVVLILTAGPVSEKTSVEKLESQHVFLSQETVLKELQSQIGKTFFPSQNPLGETHAKE